MENENKKQAEVQIEPAAVSDGSLSDADLEQVAGGALSAAAAQYYRKLELQQDGGIIGGRSAI